MLVAWWFCYSRAKQLMFLFCTWFSPPPRSQLLQVGRRTTICWPLKQEDTDPCKTSKSVFISVFLSELVCICFCWSGGLWPFNKSKQLPLRKHSLMVALYSYLMTQYSSWGLNGYNLWQRHYCSLISCLLWPTVWGQRRPRRAVESCLQRKADDRIFGKFGNPNFGTAGKNTENLYIIDALA